MLFVFPVYTQKQAELKAVHVASQLCSLSEEHSLSQSTILGPQLLTPIPEMNLWTPRVSAPFFPLPASHPLIQALSQPR